MHLISQHLICPVNTEANASSHFAEFLMIPGTIHVLVKVTLLEGESNVQVACLTWLERTGSTDLPLLRKGHQRPYQLSQQILSILWLISDLSQHVEAGNIGRVTSEHFISPLMMYGFGFSFSFLCQESCCRLHVCGHPWGCTSVSVNG